MSLRRISILAVLMLSSVALPSQSQIICFHRQLLKTQEQRRPNRNRAQWIQVESHPEQTQQIQAIRNQYQDQISQAGSASSQAGVA